MISMRAPHEDREIEREEEKLEPATNSTTCTVSSRQQYSGWAAHPQAQRRQRRSRLLLSRFQALGVGAIALISPLGLHSAAGRCMVVCTTQEMWPRDRGVAWIQNLLNFNAVSKNYLMLNLDRFVWNQPKTYWNLSCIYTGNHSSVWGRRVWPDLSQTLPVLKKRHLLSLDGFARKQTELCLNLPNICMGTPPSREANFCFIKILSAVEISRMQNLVRFPKK